MVLSKEHLLTGLSLRYRYRSLVDARTRMETAATMKEVPGDIGVILVDHGSKHEEANEMLLDVVRLYGEVSGTEIVEPAHMELAAPTLADALGRCVARGAKTVVVHPYFLFPGRHSTHDIPRLAAEAAAAYPDLEVKVTQPLNVDKAIGLVIHERILACLAEGT